MLNRIKLHCFYFQFSVSSQSTFRLPSFSHFKIHNSLQQYLDIQDIHTPTYIQYALLTNLQNVKSNNYTIKHHITSPTGSGKTLAYLLPLCSQLKQQQQSVGSILTMSMRPRAIIITSSKQLVLQVRNTGKNISHFCKLKCQAINIGRGIIQEKKLLANGIDILITTSNRLLHMIKRNQIYLSQIKWLVIDQADTLFQSGQLQNLQNSIINPVINSSIKHTNFVNIIMSSTTSPPSLRQYLHSQHQYIELIDKQTHINLANIIHEFIHSGNNKHQLIYNILSSSRSLKIMIFCNTISSLHELQYYLIQLGFSIITLHSQLSKIIRLKNYELFRDMEQGILLATDLGARGIHFPKLSKVVNYDFPRTTCDYLQRAGRTGRAGKNGLVLTLYQKKDLPIINQLQGASFKHPLKIANSAYGFKNREETDKPSKYMKN